MEREWKILDYGTVPLDKPATVSFTCPGCGQESLLPVVGTVLAQINEGLVFDSGKHTMPKSIQCRFCKRRFEVA